jgi:hypothetical protein
MKTLKVLSAAAVSVVLASCAVQKSETPLSPTVAGPIAGVQITAPKTLEPAAGAQIPGDKQPLTLLLENASSNGQRPLSYMFEIASEPGFNNRVFAQDNVPPGDAGRTSLKLPSNLTMGRCTYWRAKALDGAMKARTRIQPISTCSRRSGSTSRHSSPHQQRQGLEPATDFALADAPRQGTPATVSL